MPEGWAIATGYYAANNFSDVSHWLTLYSSPHTCPLEAGEVFGYVFQASSDLAINSALEGCIILGCGGERDAMSYTNAFKGFYNGSAFVPFTPGVYTVLAGDEWGAFAIVHFDVEQVTLQSFSLCPSNCLYPSPYLTGEIYFQGPQPVKSLQLFVNGTDEGNLGHGIGQLDVIYEYKGTFQSPQAIAGDSYVITFVALYADNSTATAKTTVVAG